MLLKLADTVLILIVRTQVILKLYDDTIQHLVNNVYVHVSEKDLLVSDTKSHNITKMNI